MTTKQEYNEGYLLPSYFTMQDSINTILETLNKSDHPSQQSINQIKEILRKEVARKAFEITNPDKKTTHIYVFINEKIQNKLGEYYKRFRLFLISEIARNAIEIRIEKK